MVIESPIISRAGTVGGPCFGKICICLYSRVWSIFNAIGVFDDLIDPCATVIIASPINGVLLRFDRGVSGRGFARIGPPIDRAPMVGGRIRFALTWLALPAPMTMVLARRPPVKEQPHPERHSRHLVWRGRRCRFEDSLGMSACGLPWRNEGYGVRRRCLTMSGSIDITACTAFASGRTCVAGITRVRRAQMGSMWMHGNRHCACVAEISCRTRTLRDPTIPLIVYS